MWYGIKNYFKVPIFVFNYKRFWSKFTKNLRETAFFVRISHIVCRQLIFDVCHSCAEPALSEAEWAGIHALIRQFANQHTLFFYLFPLGNKLFRSQIWKNMTFFHNFSILLSTFSHRQTLYIMNGQERSGPYELFVLKNRWDSLDYSLASDKRRM